MSSSKVSSSTPTKKLYVLSDVNNRIDVLNNDVIDLRSKSSTMTITTPATSTTTLTAIVSATVIDGQTKQQERQQLMLQSRQEECDATDGGTLGDGCSCNETLPARQPQQIEEETPSFLDFFRVEMTRGYILDHDEERYSARRQKIYSFIRIPRDVERFMIYGLVQCADSFLYIHTFLPVRFILAIWALVARIFAQIFRLRRSKVKLLLPAEICDLLKGSIWIFVTLLMLSVDTNRVYHIVKSQSIIKLYIFYNMLEVGDRLLSAFGQDSIDALFWTAAEQKTSKLQHFGLFTHFCFALCYVSLHSFLIMFQATTLNVAVNSNNKVLLTIMISNNFVELKGSVFKKFDKNNLFQLTCSDVRERFHLSILLFIVVIQTMKEFDWSLMQFCVMMPDCFAVLSTEVLIDWLKHAFITRFNELPESIYREYTISLAYDMTQTRQKHAFSDHSDLLARRMGFIPFPLAVVLIKAIHSAVSFDNLAAWLIFLLVFVFVMGVRICLTICALGKACKLMKEHQEERNNSTPSSTTNVPTVNGNSVHIVGSSTATSCINVCISKTQNVAMRNDAATSSILQRIRSFGTNNKLKLIGHNRPTTSTPNKLAPISNCGIQLDVTNSLNLGATALFSNSDVDLDDACLNEHVLENNASDDAAFKEEDLARSEPDLKLLNGNDNITVDLTAAIQKEHCKRLPTRVHKRSESEPSMQSIVGDIGESQA